MLPASAAACTSSGGAPCAGAAPTQAAPTCPPAPLPLQARRLSTFTYLFSLALFVTVCVLVFLKFDTDEVDLLFRTKDW